MDLPCRNGLGKMGRKIHPRFRRKPLFVPGKGYKSKIKRCDREKKTVETDRHVLVKIFVGVYFGLYFPFFKKRFQWFLQ